MDSWSQRALFRCKLQWENGAGNHEPQAVRAKHCRIVNTCFLSHVRVGLYGLSFLCLLRSLFHILIMRLVFARVD